jgi:hypothetical protein
MDVLYGNAVLFKVLSKALECSNIGHSYEVVDMLTDSIILDKFFEHYMPSYGLIDFVSEEMSPLPLCDECSSSDCQNSNEKTIIVESKRKAGSLDESTSESNVKKLNKYPKII